MLTYNLRIENTQNSSYKRQVFLYILLCFYLTQLRPIYHGTNAVFIQDLNRTQRDGQSTFQLQEYVTCKYLFPLFVLETTLYILHECSPFWVAIFIAFNKENYHVYCFI